MLSKCCLSVIAIDQGKVLLLKASSLKPGYPAKISSTHSPVRAILGSGFTFYQNNNKKESISAMPSISRAIIALSRASANSGCLKQYYDV